MELSKRGTVVEEAINSIPTHYKNVIVDKYVIMPNHIHLILTIQNNISNGRLVIAPTTTESTNGRLVIAPTTTESTNRRLVIAPTTTVSTIIKELKRYVSKQIGFSIWQKSFHDHIIRNEEDYIRIAEYIESNPANWQEDRYHT